MTDEATILQKFRAKYPGQFDKTSDRDLAEAIRAEYFPEVPPDEWHQKVGTVFTPEEQRSDIGKSIGTGIAHIPSHLPGMFGDLGELTNRGLDLVWNKVTGQDYHSPKGPLPTSEDVQKFAGDMLKNNTGLELHQPETPQGSAAETGADIIGSALLPGGGSRALSRTAFAARGSKEYQDAVKLLEKEGLVLPAGVASERPLISGVEDTLAPGKYHKMVSAAEEKLTEAAMKRAGVPGSRFSKKVETKAFGDIGKEFDGLESRNMVLLDKPLGTDLGNLFVKYDAAAQQSLMPGGIINDWRDRFLNFKGSAIPGNVYKEWGTEIRKNILRAGSSTERKFYRDLKDVMDNSMERYIAKYNPQDLGAWKDVRGRYSKLMILKKANKNSKKGALGIIEPGRLRTAAGDDNSELAELGRAGQAVFDQFPKNNIVSRIVRGAARAGVKGGVGAAAASGGAGPLAGAAAGLTIPWAVGRAMLGKSGRRFLRGKGTGWGTGTVGGAAGLNSWLGSLPYDGGPSEEGAP